MRILIDAMSGDKAPDEIVKGAVDAANEFNVDITLIGQENVVRDCLQKLDAAGNKKVTVVHASDVITMEDDPATSVRHKKDSSMSVMLKMISEGAGDACISAGNSGALLSGATLVVKRIRGIRRGAFAPVLPNGKKGVMLIDAGANVECTAEYLLQFAFMGSFYAKEVMGCESPRVGLLNNGTEECKGTALQNEAYALLSAASEAGQIHFIGNVEGSSVLSGDVDVVVCDGFSGNILLKTLEGTAKFLMHAIKDVFMKSTKNKIAALMVKSDVGAVKAMMDVNEIGGTAILGISKPVIKAHGSSDARAIRSAVKQAIAFCDANVIEKISDNMEYMSLKTKAE